MYNKEKDALFWFSFRMSLSFIYFVFFLLSASSKLVIFTFQLSCCPCHIYTFLVLLFIYQSGTVNLEKYFILFLFAIPHIFHIHKFSFYLAYVFKSKVLKKTNFLSKRLFAATLSLKKTTFYPFLIKWRFQSEILLSLMSIGAGWPCLGRSGDKIVY